MRHTSHHNRHACASHRARITSHTHHAHQLGIALCGVTERIEQHLRTRAQRVRVMTTHSERTCPQSYKSRTCMRMAQLSSSPSAACDAITLHTITPTTTCTHKHRLSTHVHRQRSRQPRLAHARRVIDAQQRDRLHGDVGAQLVRLFVGRHTHELCAGTRELSGGKARAHVLSLGRAPSLLVRVAPRMPVRTRNHVNTCITCTNTTQHTHTSRNSHESNAAPALSAITRPLVTM
jgi:hypothetical protein